MQESIHNNGQKDARTLLDRVLHEIFHVQQKCKKVHRDKKTCQLNIPFEFL